MRYLISGSLMVCMATVLFFSCKKWTDPAPVDDPRLTNPYCNDPEAVNYNKGFPGKPDNSVCIYPADLFAGSYFYKDSVVIDSSELFVGADSFTITISKIANRKMNVSGFCTNGSILSLTAGVTNTATLDTNVGDTTTLHVGQIFCNSTDTAIGTITRDLVDSSVLHVYFEVYTQGGTIIHSGVAKKQ